MARLEASWCGRAAASTGRAPAAAACGAFLSRGYWRRLAERPLALAIAWALLLVPAVSAGLWAGSDPGAALGVVPSELQAAADPPPEGRDFDAAEGAAFST